jgi:hypothetical protein
MAAIGGDIIEITYNHPTLGSGVIYPKAAEDSTFDIGGFRSSDDANMIDGAGQMIDQMNRTRWSVETTVAWDMNTGLTLERLTQLTQSPLFADWTVTHINGTIYGGKGKPVGDLQGNGNAATFTFKLAGGGVLKKIA